MRVQMKPIMMLVAGIVILALSACAPGENVLPETGGTEQPEGTSPAAEAGALIGPQWRLVSYGTPGSETQVLADTEVTLQLEENGQAGGSGGCNSFGTEYEIVDGVLAFGDIITTEIACMGEGVMEQEQAYYDALRTAGEFDLVDGRLVLWYDAGQRNLIFEETAPTS